MKHIDADQLPAFLGGTMTDPDGNVRCPSKVRNTVQESTSNSYTIRVILC